MHRSSLESAPEAFDCEEEINGVVRDLRTKQHSARSSNSTPSWHVDEQTKVELARQASHATLPGFVVEQYNQFFRHKPSSAQLESMGNLRQVQKNRRAHQNREEQLPEPFRGNEEQPLDAFQQSMTHFRIQEEQRTKMENDGLMIEKRKRMHWLLVAIVAGIIVFVGTGVRVAVGLRGGSPSRGAKTNSFQDCCMRDDTLPSDRFVQLRNLVSSVWRWGTGPSLIESAGSSPRVALCWLSAVDRFEPDKTNSTEYEVVQRFALAATYYHFVGTALADQGNEGLSGSNWLDNVHVCAWHFVTCDPNKRVTELFLDNMQFGDKQIPEVLALMSDLVGLKLTSSRLTGQVPTALSRLTQLQVLDLHSNTLTGTIPPELGFLTELRAINFANNLLGGEIPRQFFEIPQLHDLVLRNNFFAGMLPGVLGNATSLTTFSVEVNRYLSGTIPDISQLTNLEYLGIGGSLPVQDSFPDIARLTNLVFLKLSNMYLTGTIPSYIWFFPSLAHLNLGNTYISGTIPAAVGLPTNLQTLHLGGTKIAGSLPTTMGNLSNLRFLFLGSLDGLTGTIPTEFGRLSSLELLDLPAATRSKLSGSVPDEVCALVALDLRGVSCD